VGCDLPDFVSENPSEVVGGAGTTREGRVHQDHTVPPGGTVVPRREGCVPQKSLVGTGDRADVEC
jgi:hypothetical protein